MSKVRAAELGGEGFPAVLQPGPLNGASIGEIISGPVAEAAAGQFLCPPKHQKLLLPSLPSPPALLHPHPHPPCARALRGRLLGIITAGASEGFFLKHCSINAI